MLELKANIDIIRFCSVSTGYGVLDNIRLEHVTLIKNTAGILVSRLTMSIVDCRAMADCGNMRKKL